MCACSPQARKKLLHLQAASARWTRHHSGPSVASRDVRRLRYVLSSLVFSEPVSFAIYKKKLLFLPCWNYWIKSYFYKFVMNWIMTILRIKFLERKPHTLTISIRSVPNRPNLTNLPQVSSGGNRHLLLEKKQLLNEILISSHFSLYVNAQIAFYT